MSVLLILSIQKAHCRFNYIIPQIYLIYYGLGQFEAVRESVLWFFLKEAYWCALLAFMLNTAAYTTEIFRGGIEAVPFG